MKSSEKTPPNKFYHINRKLVPVKLLTGFFWGGNMALNPFFTLYMKSLGITLSQIAVINSIFSWTSIAAGPLVTTLADKSGRYKLVFGVSLILCNVLNGIIAVSLPVGDVLPVLNLSNQTFDLNNITSAPLNGTTNIGSNLEAMRDSSTSATFYVMLALYLTSGWVSSSCFVMLDAVMTTTTAQHNGDFGINRAVVSAAIMTFPLFSGIIIDCFQGHWTYEYQQYFPAFGIYTVCLFLSVISLLMTDIAPRPSAKNLWRNVWKIVLDKKNSQIWVFLGVVFFVGFCIGYMEGFLFLFFDELFVSLPKSVLGAESAVAGSVGMVVVSQSKSFVNRLGHMNTLILSVAVYGVRFIAYSFLSNIWMIYPIGALTALSNALMWSVACDYAGKLVPDYVATFLSLVTTVQVGFGLSFGYLIGGFVHPYLGTRVAYRLGCGACFALVILYVAVELFRRQRSRQAQSKNHSLSLRNPEKDRKEQPTTELNMADPLIEHGDENDAHGTNQSSSTEAKRRLSIISVSGLGGARASVTTIMQ